MGSKDMHVAHCSTLWGQRCDTARWPACTWQVMSPPRYWSLVPDILYRICEAPRRRRLNAVYLIRVEALGRPKEASLSESQAHTEINAVVSLKNNVLPLRHGRCSAMFRNLCIAPRYLASSPPRSQHHHEPFTRMLESTARCCGELASVAVFKSCSGPRPLTRRATEFTA